MDSARTASQNLELRKKFIQRQNNMNYRNEYDRLHGELLGLGSPDKIKEAINMMMDKDKLKAIGEYKEPDSIGPVGPTVATPVAPRAPKTPGVDIFNLETQKGERRPIDVRDDQEDDKK